MPSLATRLARRTHAWVFALGLALLVAPLGTRAEIEITLKNSFIEAYKNRATIEANYVIDKAHKKPNPPSKDGDMHVAGRTEEVGLPIVAEIMNAKFQKAAVNFVHENEGTGEPVVVAGAWRIWCEHGGSGPQVQGEPLEPFQTSNPDHVFEIHPITKLGDSSLLGSLAPIVGFRTKDAQQAFTSYERIDSQIVADAEHGTTKIVTTMGGYNYVEFIMELNEDPSTAWEDGRAVMASVLDLGGELIVRNRRMIFVKDSAPEKAVRKMKKGARLHVLGLPRIDLALVSWRTTHGNERPEVLRWKLPYEMIIAAVYQ